MCACGDVACVSRVETDARRLEAPGGGLEVDRLPPDERRAALARGAENQSHAAAWAHASSHRSSNSSAPAASLPPLPPSIDAPSPPESSPPQARHPTAHAHLRSKTLAFIIGIIRYPL